MSLNVACIQLNSGADMNANIARVETLVKDAADKGAQFVTLPENAFLMDEPKSERTLYAHEDHPALRACEELAKRSGIWLLAGSVAVDSKSDKKMYNRSVLFDDKGQQVSQYDKIHLFDVEVGDGQVYRESARFESGGKAAIVDTPWGKLGMTVCYDVRFPQLFRALAKAGAEIIAVPSAFTQVTGEAHWHVLLRARAIENGCFIIAPAQTGIHPGNRKTFGHSLIIDPWGKVLADGETGEKIIMAELDLSQVKRVRASLPSLTHDRDFQ